MTRLTNEILSGLQQSVPAGNVGAVLEAAVLVAGLGSVSYGAWLAWPPAGFLAGGTLLIAGVLLRARGGE